jgi:hypothetical protein
MDTHKKQANQHDWTADTCSGLVAPGGKRLKTTASDRVR